MPKQRTPGRSNKHVRTAKLLITAVAISATMVGCAVLSARSDIQAIFAQLDVHDAAHAFYLGKELARASLAVALGKTYRQEGPLAWGYLTPPPGDPQGERVRLAGRASRGNAQGEEP